MAKRWKTCLDVWNSDGGLKEPPNRASLVSLRVILMLVNTAKYTGPPKRWPNGEKLASTCVQIWSRPKWAYLIMTKMAEISSNWYPIYDQHSRKTIPFGTAHTYIADIREYHPRGAHMFKKPWRTSVTMNNSQRRRALLPLYLQTRRILILHVTRVLMYTSTVTAKEFIDIDIDIRLWAKFRQRHVNPPKLRCGNVWNSDGGLKEPP